jgi:ornithine cyclodeaminase/alanine dehydrogenase
MLLLSRKDIASLLTFDDYVRIVEDAFRLHAQGAAFEPALAHVDAIDGEFHIKAGGLRQPFPYFGVKMNGGFFKNHQRFGLPNIQGLILLSQADNGVPLAVMDSIEVTIQRTGAATAVAAKYLARPDSKVATICGCGNQGKIQLRALKHALPLEKAHVWSPFAQEAERFAAAMTELLTMDVAPAPDLPTALGQSDVCVTCTPSRSPFIRRDWIPPGMFIAAVGADSPDKQELDADLVAACTVVADLRAQSAAVGEAHHAIRAGLMTAAAIHAELGEIIAGLAAGRISDAQRIVFDSTGTALQDVAAAAAVYERARALEIGLEWSPTGLSGSSAAPISPALK